jgi:ribose 5-phosphate isomerase
VIQDFESLKNAREVQDENPNLQAIELTNDSILEIDGDLSLIKGGGSVRIYKSVQEEPLVLR